MSQGSMPLCKEQQHAGDCVGKSLEVSADGCVVVLNCVALSVNRTLVICLVGPEHCSELKCSEHVRNMLPDYHGILVSGFLDAWKL